MLHRLTVYFLCAAMLGMSVLPQPVYTAQRFSAVGPDQAQLLEKYPNARIVRVSPDQYLALEKELHQRGYRPSAVLTLAQNTDANEQRQQRQDTMSIEPLSGEATLSGDCVAQGDSPAGEDSVRLMVDFTDDLMNSSSNGSSGDGAAVVFVIVGTVVVVVWALYVFKYLYDVSVGATPCGGWNELTALTAVSSSATAQHLRFEGLRYATGFRADALDVGLSFELGQADILLKEAGTLDLQGRYWLLGPMLRWRLSQDANPSYFQMDFVAGSTEHDAVGLLAKASMGLLFGIGDALQFGLNWGVVKINLDENQGIISDRNQYHYVYSASFGFKF